ncbi:MAG: class I SAM-dependent methyltransferase [Planctomycetota bacterium]|nr:MAG: class I SAM-dependent methyltransferase [Planctomycetota bacterium]
MDLEALQFLKSEQAQRFLEEHLESNPEEVARRYKGKNPFLPALATQIRCLQKAKAKLPTYHASRCLLEPLALEQASGEKAAEMKATGYSGERFLELGGGLGVDSLYFAKNFLQNWVVERNNLLVEMGEYNFNKLQKFLKGEVHWWKGEARDFLQLSKGNFDLVYVDPLRRGKEGRKHIHLANCQPNVLDLLPSLWRITQVILVKASPMLDLEWAQRKFQGSLRRICVQSVERECKEVLLELSPKKESQTTVECRFFRNGQIHRYTPLSSPKTIEKWADLKKGWPPSFYAYEADVALYKAKLAKQFLQEKYPHLEGGWTEGPGLFLSPQWEKNFLGRIFEIKEVYPFSPKRLRKQWKGRQFQIWKRYFGIPHLKSSLGVREGGKEHLLFVSTKGKRWVLLAKEITKKAPSNIAEGKTLGAKDGGPGDANLW